MGRPECDPPHRPAARPTATMNASSRCTLINMRPGEEHLMSDLAPLAEAVTVDPLVGHPADYHVFHQSLDRCKDVPAITTAVVGPQSDVALKGAIEAAAAGLIEPTIIGA